MRIVDILKAFVAVQVISLALRLLGTAVPGASLHLLQALKAVSARFENYEVRHGRG